MVRVETEQEREFAQQLKQANDAVARLQDELSDIRLRSAPLWEKEMKNRDSKIFVLLLLEFAWICALYKFCNNNNNNNVNSCCVDSVSRLSVGLSSVMFVHHTQVTEILGNVSMPFGTLAICDPSVKILRRSSQGNPYVGGLNQRGVEKCNDFGPFQGYISETVQDRR